MRSNSLPMATLTAALPVLLSVSAIADTTDTTPDGMLAFFDQGECPSGWSAYSAANGRLLLGYTNTTLYTPAAAVGTALGDQAVPTHTHGFQTQVNVGSKGLAATSGTNTHGAGSGNHALPGGGASQPVNAAASGLGFIQRTLCRKNEAEQYAATALSPDSPEPEADPAAAPIPLPGGALGMCSMANDPYPYGTLAFFTLTAANENSSQDNYDAQPCPAGWSSPTYPNGYQADWSGSSAYCVRIAFNGTDTDGDGVLRGRGSDPSTISGGYQNELTDWSMTVYQNDCGTGSQLAAYSWAQQQARTDFNLNFNLTGLQVIASGNYNTDVGLAAGIYAPAASGPQNYNFGSVNGGGTTEIVLESMVPSEQTVSTSPLGTDRFVSERALAYVNGSFLMPFASSVLATNALAAVGSPVANQGPVATHVHDLSSSISLGTYAFQLAGGSTEHLGSTGSHAFTATSSSDGLGLPYLQLLLCQKCSAAITALPSALDNVVVSSAAACPGAVQGGQGWTSSSPDLGRLSVAQAPGSPSPGATFGGAPLTAPTSPSHTHKFSGSVSIGGHGVTGSHSSCNCCELCEKVGKSGTPSFSGSTDATAATAPYLAVAACRPCGGAGQAACATSTAVPETVSTRR